MKRLLFWAICLALLLMAVPTWAQDAKDCSAEGIKNQMNELMATYLSAQAKAKDAAGALAAADDLQKAIAALTTGCANGPVEAEATTEAVNTGMPIEGKWTLTWAYEKQICPGTNFESTSLNRSVILKVDPDKNKILLEDVFRLTPGEFSLSPDGTYHFLRNLKSDDGQPFSYDYAMTEIKSATISGKTTDFYSWLDCHLVNTFEMTLADKNIICMVGSDSSANLRSGPGTTFDRFGKLDARKTVDVDGYATSEDGFKWWRLATGGWIRSDLVKEAGRCENVPETKA